jgi:hypothetical protein
MASRRKYASDVATENHEAMASSLPSPEIPVSGPTGEASEAVRVLQDQIASLRKAKEQEVVVPSAEDRRREWLQDNPAARQHVAALNDLHREALDAGHTDTSPRYFDYMNDRLASLSAQHPAPGAHVIEDMQKTVAQEKQPQRQPPESAGLNASYVSAPVSRDTVSYSTGRPSNGRITLTPQDIEYAKIAGVTPTEYAKQKLKLQEMKETGEYGDRR